MRSSTVKLTIGGVLLIIAMITGYFLYDIIDNHAEPMIEVRFWQLLICTTGATLLAGLFLILGFVEWWANRDLK